MPDPSRKRPANQLGSRAGYSRSPDAWPTSLALSLPLVAWWHATASTVPRVQGQGRPPGQATGGLDLDRGPSR
jgi:hypothetical protein